MGKSNGKSEAEKGSLDLEHELPPADGDENPSPAEVVSGAESSSAEFQKLKAERDGEIEVAGPDLAQSLTELGLIDEYRIYLHPVVLGHGKPYFAGPRPPLRLMAHDRIGEDVIRLTYTPA